MADLVAIDTPDSDMPNPGDMTMTELADHIEETHHTYLKAELPRLRNLIAKVADRHGKSFPWLEAVRAIFGDLADELESHMQKEERILFPMIRQAEDGRGSTQANPMMEGPVSVMEHEHDTAARALHRLRALTSGFVPPDQACNSFRAMLEGLATLDRDLRQHIHKENNILFVRALAGQNG